MRGLRDKSFHTVGGSADYANVQHHIVNKCSLLHQDHDCPRAWHMLELIYITEGHWNVELWWHDFELEFCLLKRVVCICNSACFLWYWIAVNMIIVLEIHHNHQSFETKCSGNSAYSWKHCEWKLHMIGNVQNHGHFMIIHTMTLILKWCVCYREPGFPVLCPCTRPGLTSPLQQCSSGRVCDGSTGCCTYVWTQRWQVLYSRKFSSRLVI